MSHASDPTKAPHVKQASMDKKPKTDEASPRGKDRPIASRTVHDGAAPPAPKRKKEPEETRVAKKETTTEPEPAPKKHKQVATTPSTSTTAARKGASTPAPRDKAVAPKAEATPVRPPKQTEKTAPTPAPAPKAQAHGPKPKPTVRQPPPAAPSAKKKAKSVSDDESTQDAEPSHQNGYHDGSDYSSNGEEVEDDVCGEGEGEEDLGEEEDGSEGEDEGVRVRTPSKPVKEVRGKQNDAKVPGRSAPFASSDVKKTLELVDRAGPMILESMALPEEFRFQIAEERAARAARSLPSDTSSPRAGAKQSSSKSSSAKGDGSRGAKKKMGIKQQKELAVIETTAMCQNLKQDLLDGKEVLDPMNDPSLSTEEKRLVTLRALGMFAHFYHSDHAKKKLPNPFKDNPSAEKPLSVSSLKPVYRYIFWHMAEVIGFDNPFSARQDLDLEDDQ